MKETKWELINKILKILLGGSSSGNDLETNLSKGDELKVFSYSTINLATNGFLAENKLGQGGFGPVFKVTIF
jgi:hypothetical protein